MRPPAAGPGRAVEHARYLRDAAHAHIELEPPVTDPQRPDDEWRAALTPSQYHVLREKGTERAFTGKYWNTKDDGVYRCAGCGEVLFDSRTKYDSGSGWPSFSEPADPGAVATEVDRSHGMTRTEVVCRKCGGHLGHMFEDGPRPTGLRYCINSESLDFAPREAVDRRREG
jgi:peptide-methionine (R)-S-oxide reductase